MLDAVLGAGSSEEDRIRELCLSLTPESSLEIVQDRSGPTLRPPGLRRKELRLLVREYFEFLFGPLNYATDEYLIDLESDDGWVEITDIMRWPRLRTLVLGLTRAEEIARTLVEPSVSPIVEVSLDCQRVRRRVSSLPAGAPNLAVPETEVVLPKDMLTPSPRSAAAGSFSVLQYNILAQFLARPSYYAQVQPQALDWRHRLPLIMRRIQESGADFVCLQEVQGVMQDNPDKRGDHRHAIHTALRQMGYNTRYCRKVSGKAKDIGNMVAYRTEQWEVVRDFPAWRYFCRSNEATPGLIQQCLPVLHGGDVTPEMRHYGNGNQFAVAVHLRHKQSGRELLLVTTHISVNFQNPDTQLAQVYALTQRLQRDDVAHLPKVITGDFNVMPDGPVYRFLQQGFLAGNEAVL